jgi:hypothetical protein
MIYNGVIKIPELYNTLVDEKVRLDKKYKKLKGECETVVINFIRSFSKHVLYTLYSLEVNVRIFLKINHNFY